MNSRVALRSKIFVAVWITLIVTVAICIFVGKTPRELIGALIAFSFASGTLAPYRIKRETTAEQLDEIDEIPAIAKIMFFPNGNTGVFNSTGHQVGETQGSWVNWNYLRRLARIAARDGAMTIGLSGLPEAVGKSFVEYREFYEAVDGELEDSE